MFEIAYPRREVESDLRPRVLVVHKDVKTMFVFELKEETDDVVLIHSVGPRTENRVVRRFARGAARKSFNKFLEQEREEQKEKVA